MSVPHWSECEPYPPHCVGIVTHPLLADARDHTSVTIQSTHMGVSFQGQGEVLLPHTAVWDVI